MTADKDQLRIHRKNGRTSQPRTGAVKVPARRATTQNNLPRLQVCLSFMPSAAEIQAPGPPLPIWFSALLATQCRARGKSEHRDVRWNCVSGRAVYTNAGAEEERIEPLGVSLQGGHSVAVSWMPGETAYTVEVFRQLDCVA